MQKALKNDEHMKAHVMTKKRREGREIAMFQNNKLKREIISTKGV